MKRLIIFLTSFFSVSSMAYIGSVVQGNIYNPLEEVTACERELHISIPMCLITTTTSAPTFLIGDASGLDGDDAMVQLADEISGEVDSTEMIDRMAAHFEVTAHEVVSAASDLLDTEVGLSFEGLKQELQ